MRAAALLVLLCVGCGERRPPTMEEAEARVAADLRAIDTGIGEFFLEYNDFPQGNDLTQLATPDDKGKVILEPKYMKDPWGVPYLYDRAGRRNAAAGIRGKPDVWCERDGWTIGNFTGHKARR